MNTTENIHINEPVSTKKKAVTDDHRDLVTGGYVKKKADISDQEARCLGISEIDKNKVYVCDRDQEYSLYHFYDPFGNNPSIANIRGWIVNNKNNMLVCPSWSENYHMFIESQNFLDFDWDEFTFTPYLEGTTLSVFWDDDNCHYAVNRKLDSRKSRIPVVELELFHTKGD